MTALPCPNSYRLLKRGTKLRPGRTADCPECGQRVGFAGVENRLRWVAHHQPEPTIDRGDVALLAVILTLLVALPTILNGVLR